jgi:glutamine synthetase
MEILKKCAAKHNLVCLLHEKPFACVSGSGKHNNWSLSTDTGKNLFSPGKTPKQRTLATSSKTMSGPRVARCHPKTSSPKMAFIC